MARRSAQDVATFIAERDPAFAALIAHVGPPPRRRATPVDQRFAAVLSSITSQLLSVKAADTIHARVTNLLDDDVTPERVLATSVAALKATGISTTKAEAMRALASHVIDGRVSFANHARLSDADVSAQITQVRGIGPWTAEMYLLFTLARPDVWPVGDLGVRHGWSILHGLTSPIEAGDLRQAGTPLEGERSAVAWYCWQALHLSRAGAL